MIPISFFVINAISLQTIIRFMFILFYEFLNFTQIIINFQCNFNRNFFNKEEPTSSHCAWAKTFDLVVRYQNYVTNTIEIHCK
jgi:hypothetical protein